MSFVAPQATGATSSAAWIRDRFAAALAAASGVGLSGDGSRRAAAQVVGLWLVNTSGGAREWNHNASLQVCDYVESHDCVNTASVDVMPAGGARAGQPRYTRPLAAFRNATAHAAAFWQVAEETGAESGVNYLRWMATGDVGAVFRFDQAFTNTGGLTWSVLVRAVQSVASVNGVTGLTYPDTPGTAPVQFTRSGGGFSTGGGTSTAGGGSSGGSAGGRTGTTTGGTTTAGGGSATSSGGGTTGPTTTPRRRGGGAALALLAVLAVAMSGGSKGKR